MLPLKTVTLFENTHTQLVWSGGVNYCLSLYLSVRAVGWPVPLDPPFKLALTNGLCTEVALVVAWGVLTELWPRASVMAMKKKQACIPLGCDLCPPQWGLWQHPQREPMPYPQVWVRSQERLQGPMRLELVATNCFPLGFVPSRAHPCPSTFYHGVEEHRIPDGSMPPNCGPNKLLSLSNFPVMGILL